MGSDDSRIHVPARIGNWFLEQNLGSGYSGSIWRATNPYNGQNAAIKIQDVDHECPTNRYERGFYPSLQGGKGMPTLWAAGIQGEYDYLVIDLLGPSLDNLYRKNGKIFDLRSTICIAMQVRLEFMHSRGILHRDIQLGNCVLGLGKTEKVIYMIDFGFSKRYIDPHTRKHIPDSKAKRDFIGNYWFSSINVHCRGKVPSRRDDMEALALMLIHVMTDGGLPWTRNGIPKSDKAHDVLIRRKLRSRPEDLCHNLPPVFEDFLRYCRRLKFLDQPDYRHWRNRFTDLAREMGYDELDGSINDDFEWPPRPDEIPLPYRRHATPNHDKTEGEVGIYDILQEIANMRLENNRLVNGSKSKKPQSGPKRAPETPRMAPVSLPPQTSNMRSSTNDTADSEAPSSPQTRNQSNSDSDLKKKGADFPPGTIVISDSSDDDHNKPSRQTDRATKQATMRLLTRRARSATDNTSLADLLRRFLDTFALTGTRSRVITRDALEFLDALAQQLENPSVFVVQDSQASKTSLQSTSETDRIGSTESRLRQRSRPTPAHTQKVETVKTLRQRLLEAPLTMGNLELAKMLSSFCLTVRSGSARTLTKDGVAFLEGVEFRLRNL